MIVPCAPSLPLILDRKLLAHALKWFAKKT